MTRRHALLLFTGAAALPATACLWDSDTLADEIAVNPNTLDLILGQFAHHGDAYYRLRVTRLTQIKNPDLTTLNDLAVAHVRLQEFQQAEALLIRALKTDPTHYETLSNIGVTAKKQGDFKKGALFISKALAQKPSGHMGLSDWYLKALQWRAQFEKTTPQNPPTHNFLGVAYPKGFGGDFGFDERPPRKNKETRYHQMVRNDQSFADGFVALGDHLVLYGDLNLAFLAYTRAMILGHQHPVEIKRRRRELLRHFEAYTSANGEKLRGIPYWRKQIAQTEKMIADGAAWLTLFQKTESDLLKGKKNETEVTFPQVLKEMTRRTIKKVGIKNR